MSISDLRFCLSLLIPFAIGSPLLLPATLHAAPFDSVSTPAPGSRERQELMDALRGPFAVRYHETVTFRVDRLKVGGSYAYMDAAALGANGKPAPALAPMGGSVSALYQKRNSHWTVVKWGSYGGTDLVDYARQHFPNAPRALFPSAAPTATVYTPKPGSRERAELMDALRGPFAVKYHETVTFQVSFLKVGGGYAYLDGNALGAHGRPPLHLSPHSILLISAFYKKKNGHWTVLKWDTGDGPPIVDYCRDHYPQAPDNLYP
jgi:hypothetical protein